MNCAAVVLPQFRTKFAEIGWGGVGLLGVVDWEFGRREPGRGDYVRHTTSRARRIGTQRREGGRAKKLSKMASGCWEVCCWEVFCQADYAL